MRIVVVILVPMVTHKDMNMSQHTPAPWITNKRTEIVTANDYYLLAACISDDGTSVANAAHIVKCVNMHYELVNSGAAFLQWLRDFMGNEAMSEINSIALNAFEAALAKVQS